MATPEQWITVPRWSDFQHYRDRRPTWIKNYPRQLHDAAYLELAPAARGILHDLRMLFAEYDGVLPLAVAEAVAGAPPGTARVQLGNYRRAFRAHLEALQHAGFITITASRPLALRYQVETEKEKEGSKGPTSDRRPSFTSNPPASSSGTNRHANHHDCPTCHGDRLILADTTSAGELYRPCPECGVHVTDEPSRGRTRGGSGVVDAAGELVELEHLLEGVGDA